MMNTHESSTPNSQSTSFQRASRILVLGSFHNHSLCPEKFVLTKSTSSSLKGMTSCERCHSLGRGMVVSQRKAKLVSSRSCRSTIALCSQNPRGLSGCIFSNCSRFSGVGQIRSLSSPRYTPIRFIARDTGEVPDRCIPRMQIALELVLDSIASS